MSSTRDGPKPVSTSESATIVISIKDIKAFQLPNVGLLKRSGNFYMEVKLGGLLKLRTVPVKGPTASWMESFTLDAHDSSVLECQIYAKPMMGTPNFIGGSKETIGSLLAQRASGSITLELFKFDAGNQRKIRTSIQFTIAVGLKPEADSSSFQRVRKVIDVSDTVISSTKPNRWDPFLHKIKLLIGICDAVSELHPYAKMAWAVLSATPKVVIDHLESGNNILRLIEVMDDTFSFLQEAEPVKRIESHRKVVTMMAQQTIECAYFIRDYTMRKTFWERAFDNSCLSGYSNKITEYEDKFKSLKMAFQDRAILQTGIAVFRIFDNVEHLVQDFDLSGMPYSEGARYDPDKGCMPGTREDIIEEICQWINSPNSDGDAVPRIFFLTGVAGYGKSAIAHAVARRFDQLGRLGSSYCFNRADQSMRHPGNLLSTIALDIADLDDEWKKSLCRIVKGKRSLRTTRSVAEQFDNFILEPAAALTAIGPIVIVIDGLDESGDPPSRKVVLDILAKRVAKLPTNFRIIITARPETDIIKAFSANRYVFCKALDTMDSRSNESDISLYIATTLSCIPSLNLRWPQKKWCLMLLEGSDGLFQWASTACRAILDGQGGLRPTELLLRFCSSARGLDGLYAEVLNQTFKAEDPIIMARFKSVMGRILACKEPLSVKAQSMMWDDDDADIVGLIVQSMGALLSGVNQTDMPIRALHASFYDFLTDASRSRSYYVDSSQQNRCLTLSAFRVMRSELRFDICGLETSHLHNCDVPDLPARVKASILPHLSYSCRFVSDHLVATTSDPTILDEVRHFLKHNLLYWLEVLSLIKYVGIASSVLQAILKWNQHGDEEVTSFANDAIKFVSVFGPPISQSAPHIYLSALPFSPQKSLVAQHYMPQFPSTIHLKTGKAEDWPGSIGVFEGHTSVVSSIALSPDGKRIVSGSFDRTIRIWDAVSGDIVLGPLKGHTDWIFSVAYSQDGKRIMSGSDDRTIRVWDAETGDVVLGPLMGHTDWVLTVKFSRNGKNIASGSHDRTIRIWDAESGNVTLGPLEGHTLPVNSVAFSQDGKRIVSGSDDRTIRVWDAVDGNMILGPFMGHTLAVFSVAFSHDDKRIVSGSEDYTICVWDVETESIVLGPLKGHTDWVRSVEFSPDDKQIVSGSYDRTVRVWDSESGQIMFGPLEGHMLTVFSVAFSSDGKHVVSGSEDRTIRTWDATQNTKSKLLKGHTAWVRSVKFSGNGKRIVSSSYDQTVRVWDSDTGESVLGPLEGHTLLVNSVAFSPDSRRIVSGSEDQTIRIWDAMTGEVVLGPLEGHTEWVRSVKFSRDGKRILSSSADRTIRIWDAATGDVVLGPLVGHTLGVNSVAFSYDNRRIVSGSDDHTIRVWDAVTGEIILGPLEGHTGAVNSVEFSHDDKRIVSGANDRSVRIWDAETGTASLGPLFGHTTLVDSVDISPDGRLIVSGSEDHTICVWDAVSGNMVLGPLEGHLEMINCVAFSPDSKHFASGSDDHTIRIWDIGVTAGNTLLGLQENDGDQKTATQSKNGEGNFNDTSKLEGGWILNSPSSLLFWVPHWNRTGLWWPRNTAVIGNVSTQLDCSKFMHGPSWQKCRSVA